MLTRAALAKEFFPLQADNPSDQGDYNCPGIDTDGCHWLERVSERDELCGHCVCLAQRRQLSRLNKKRKKLEQRRKRLQRMKHFKADAEKYAAALGQHERDLHRQLPTEQQHREQQTPAPALSPPVQLQQPQPQDDQWQLFLRELHSRYSTSGLQPSALRAMHTSFANATVPNDVLLQVLAQAQVPVLAEK